MRDRATLFFPLIIFVVILPLLWLGLGRDPQELPSALINQPFPDFSLTDLEDAELTRGLEDIKGKVMLVSVWATWCFACSLEHKMLNDLARKGVSIVGLNYKDDRRSAKNWLTERGNPYAFSIFDQMGSLGLDLGVYGAPETYLLDSDSIVRHRSVGVLDEDVWENEFLKRYEKLLNGSKEM